MMSTPFFFIWFITNLGMTVVVGLEPYEMGELSVCGRYVHALFARFE